MTPATAMTEPPVREPLIRLRNVSKSYSTGGRRFIAVSNVTMDVREGDMVALVGPSGCGKTTVLKILAGLHDADEGEVRIGSGRSAFTPGRDVGMVFQQALLLKWRTILENVMLPAEILDLPRQAAEARARELIRMVGLAGFEDKYPYELSGGMQQRAAIARALVYDAPLLLMDEPFGALDALTREQMNSELQRIWQASGKTVIFITHSIPEAVFLADRIVVMSPRPGRVLKIIANPIPRMRTLDDMLRPEFGALVRDIRSLLGGHVAGGESHGTSTEW